ncbi:unnamed protein product [Adineta steineri]|uniref:Uncharacterized protein n=1 Tax=Adineta steineri TaxID=433720 RepID=A0A813TH28_9BILA|nr:unnamed protein product [Adineta steineri]CAF3775095.1 unnamed protein product [Adineta steineri]
MPSRNNHYEPTAPPMYPDGGANARPAVPPRSDIRQYPQHQQHPQEHRLLSDDTPPDAPPRMDVPSSRSNIVGGSRRVDNEENTGDANVDSTCNYNTYARKKAIGIAFLGFTLLTSNVMQLRTLILQKQHDGFWTASLILVCVSFLFLIGLALILYVLIKGDIRNVEQQTNLERFNTLALVVILFICIVNILINAFMLSTNPKHFLDNRSLEILQQAQNSK